MVGVILKQRKSYSDFGYSGKEGRTLVDVPINKCSCAVSVKGRGGMFAIAIFTKKYIITRETLKLSGNLPVCLYVFKSLDLLVAPSLGL